MDPDRRRAVYIIVAIVVVVGIGWAYYSSQKSSQQKTTTSQTPTVSNLTNLDPADFDAAVKSEYALASSKAVEADSSLKISEIEVNVDKNLQTDSINTRYIFSSSNDAKNNWMITIAATTQNYIRASVPKDDYAGAIAPFDTSLWKYNYVTALQLAEKAGGLDWRNLNTLESVKMTLKTADTGTTLTWTVQYSGGNTNKTIVLDATTGKVVE